MGAFERIAGSIGKGIADKPIRDDKISSPRIETLHPFVRQSVIDNIKIAESSLPEWMAVRIVQALRTIEYQNDLYAQGRTKPGKIVTHARGGDSYHNYGLGMDFALAVDKDRNGTYEVVSWDVLADLDRDGDSDWQEVVIPFKNNGWTWGGDFTAKNRDHPHLQKSFGLSVQKLKEKYNQKLFLPGTNYVMVF